MPSTIAPFLHTSLLLFLPLLFYALAIIFPSSSIRSSSSSSVDISSSAYDWNRDELPKCKKLLIRKEWRSWTRREKMEWVGAVKCLANIKHQRLSLTNHNGTTTTMVLLGGKRSLYDDFSYSHAVVHHSAHGNAYFLPWHRWFIHLFDISLRDNCGYRGPTPYWDWSRDHADLFHSPIFEDSPEYGLGGTGDCDSTDCIVTTGAFAAGNFELAWPVQHSLRRNLTLLTGWFEHEQPQNRTLGPETVRNWTEQTKGDFFRFQHAMEALHDHVHNFVGGDLSGDCPKVMPEEACHGLADKFTPNDPLFWLHHVQLDRLWSRWQRHFSSNFHAFSGMPMSPHNMNDTRYDVDAHADFQMPFDTQGVSVSPRRVFDTESWPLCYRYMEEEEQTAEL